MLKKCLLLLMLLSWQSILCAGLWQLSYADDKQSNPDFIQGGMLSYLHEPTSWQWRAQRTWLNQLQLGLGVSGATWHSDAKSLRSAKAKRNLHAFAMTPTATVTLYQGKHVQPYIVGSVGPAYLSTIQFGGSHLGSHAAFQDRLGIGARIGTHWDAAINYTFHYSNANLASHNQGVDIHWLAGVGYHTGEAQP